MAILNFQKPNKITMIESTDFEGRFEFKPLEPGFGLTVGNALRRVLLSSLEGYAITSIRIEGVEHEFSTIEGVVEDVMEIILNLKQLRLKKKIEGVDSDIVHFKISNKDKITGADIQNFMTSFEVLNPDLVICNMENSVEFSAQISIAKGRGFIPSDENKKSESPLGTIAMDSIFTPIKNVKYTIDDFRVEQRTDYEKLTFHIITDGSIHPKEALKEASKILIYHFNLLSDEKIVLEEEKDTEDTGIYDAESLRLRQLLRTKLMDLDLSQRAYNCLKSGNVQTLGDLISRNKEELMKFRNFGKKSMVELEDLVKEKGLEFGMNLSSYKLNEE